MNRILNSRSLPALVTVLLIIFLLLQPTGYEGAQIYKGAERCSARVLATDESRIISTGLIQSGEQICTIEFLGGKFKGQMAEGFNMLTGAMSEDKVFQKGDKALVVVSYQGEDILSVNMIDHDRIDGMLLLAGLFVIFLLLFAGRTGAHAILSFILTILAIWKLIIPALLNGFNPVGISILVVLLLTVLIISLVYGFDRRALAAVSGSALGILTTALLGAVFTHVFKIHGAVMAYSEALLYNGYHTLNLTSIFISSIFFGASGAVMDLAVDITSAVHEVVCKKPDISWKDAVRSGFNVGKAAMGTMSTTLLLAYSGGYMALLMVFMAQGTPVGNILNYKYVSAEILHTIVGSFGLVTVAPFTALTSGILLAKRSGKAPAAGEGEV